MTILGTKRFWIPSSGSTGSQSEDQILKNSGYINIQLFSAHYRPKGNIWQKTFGGCDNIALSTGVTYQTSAENIEATSIQNVSHVDVKRTYNLGLQRNIAIKIPANADALELTVKITAVKNDNLQAIFDMLNKQEFQAALQLAPAVVGQVITITSLVKELFTETGPTNQLEAIYAGIISSEKESSPVSNGYLTKGHLLLISMDDGESFVDVDESKFVLKGDTLYYGSDEIENTYIVFNISFENYKGDDEKSHWFKKYAEALSHLDKIQTIVDPTEVPKIYLQSKNTWIEGNALLDADSTYLYGEKTKIKTTMLNAINQKYNGLTPASAPPAAKRAAKKVIGITPEILGQLSGPHPATLATIEKHLPSTSAFLAKHFDIDLHEPLTDRSLPLIDISATSTFNILGSDANNYVQGLKAEGKKLKLI
jgi:hypothetical protein